ncbi:glycosyltransferase family 4 protein [Frisingicoccus sp.]|uniref:glycosyltransferase family 4 protein n=1 Tax=Frisingicoccus sp. TaxID=1918627 RepID=UPI00304BC453
MGKIALNYIYLSRKHAGGKDQVGLNLLRGFFELGCTKNMLVFCFDYSYETIKSIAPDVEIVPLKCKVKGNNELMRLSYVSYINTFKLPELIKKYSVDLIYHLSCNNGLKKFDCISVVIPHDIKAVSHRVLADVKIPFYKYYLYKWMYKLDFEHADYIIAISDFDKDDIKSFYPKYRKKVHRIYNPIVTENIQRPKKGKGKYICALNLQFIHKNIITLIKAYEMVKDEISYNLVLIGSVPKRVAFIKEYVKKHNLQNRIKFTGFISDDEVNKIFENCVLYVNPSLYEGFGMTAVEAMIKKLPILVSKIPAHYEVTMGLANYYEPAENEKALAEMLIWCLSNQPAEEQLEAISKKMVSKYDYVNISRQYYEFFKHILL